MRYGDLVKIEDIGPLASFIRRVGNEIELELCGERFWMPADLVNVIDSVDAEAA